MPIPPPTLFIPEQAAIAEPRANYAGFFITRPWLELVRQIADLMRRISSTGTAGGVVVTDENGIAQVVLNELDTQDYAASDFSWDVEDADRVTHAYGRLGRMATVAFSLVGTTVVGTPSMLRIAIPEGRTAAKSMQMLVEIVDNGAAPEVGRARVTAGGSTIDIERLDGSPFSAATDATDVHGIFTFEVNGLS